MDKYARKILDDQGVTLPAHAVKISVSIELGYDAPPSDCKLATFGGSVFSAVGVKAASKNKHSITLTDLCKEALVSGDLSKLDRHFTKLSRQMMQKRTDSHSVETGARILDFWHRARDLGRLAL